VFSYQCRKFKGSEAVRSRAGVIYDKFKTLFLLPGDTADNHEVNLTVFLLITRRFFIFAKPDSDA